MSSIVRIPSPIADSVASAIVPLRSGRSVEIDSGQAADRLVVRARSGEVVLRIEIGDGGPILRFSGAEVELTASRRLDLSAEEMHLRSQRDMRIEAACVEVQANSANVAMRAMGRIALDGEHIGLNDDPCPAPFAWSAIADEETEEQAK